jgi:small GTP-binding protein
LQIDQDKIFIRALERGENIVSMIELPETAIDLLIKLANSSDSQITNLGILPISTDEREQKPNKDDSKGTKIGKYQGAILSETIEGYPGTIRCLSFHPEGQILASGSDDTTITLWNTKSSELIHVLKGHFSYVMSLAFSPDGSRLASGSNDSTIKIWEVASGQLLRTFNGHLERVNSVVFDPSGKFLYSGSFDSKIKLWNVTTGELLKTLEGHKHRVNGLILIPDQNILVSGSDDFTIKLWDTRNNQEIRMLEGHTNNVVSLDFNPKKKILASGSFDKTIKIWDMSGGYSHKNLLGHTGEIDIVRFSADGQLLASKSKDGTIRIWSCDTWQTVVVIQEPTLGRWISGLSFNPKETLLAAIGSAPDVPHNEKCRQIRLWKFDTDILCRKMKNDEIVDNNAVQDKINYITAKLVLVGDSGVGKTGLGWRLAHGKFKEHSSTHGQQFWVVDNLCTTRKDGTECEAVLWDLAGQHIYRSIHAIFLNKVDASLILFDPSNRQDPLKGIQFWLEQLKGKGQLPPTVLVGARVDRGAPSLSQDYLSQFCQRYDIKGGYISTSAKSGEGLAYNGAVWLMLGKIGALNLARNGLKPLSKLSTKVTWLCF